MMVVMRLSCMFPLPKKLFWIGLEKQEDRQNLVQVVMKHVEKARWFVFTRIRSSRSIAVYPSVRALAVEHL